MLDLRLLFAPKWGVRQNNVVTVFFLNITDILSQGITTEQVRRLNAMQDHIHHSHDIGQRGFFKTKEGFALDKAPLFGGKLALFSF